MSEIKFKNTRFNPEKTPFLDLAKQMAKAFGYTAELELDQQLAQLLRLRVAKKMNVPTAPFYIPKRQGKLV